MNKDQNGRLPSPNYPPPSIDDTYPHEPLCKEHFHHFLDDWQQAAVVDTHAAQQHLAHAKDLWQTAVCSRQPRHCLAVEALHLALLVSNEQVKRAQVVRVLECNKRRGNEQ